MHVLQLLVQIGAILLAGRLLGLAFRRVGQPGVIAEILAGILLGPSLLGLLAPTAEAALFPEASLPVLSMMSQIGLVFFMFLVGLEFDPSRLGGSGRASVAISASGIVLPFALGAGLSLPLYATLAPEGVPQLTFALFMGAAMSVTAFPVLARILAERRLIRTRIGTIALAAAAVDDVTAWCLIAAVVAVASASGALPAIRTALLAVAYVAVMWRVVRPMLARVGPRGGAAVSSDLVAAIFLLLLTSAGITEWIGIHALFGAFLFGVIVPRKHGLADVLVEKLEDLVTLVLLPMFFAYSGLRTQITLLNTPSAWGVAGVILVVATLGKFGGTALAARLSGLDGRTSAAVGILMNTRGLMELVVLNIGLDLGVISPELFAMMVVMALVTTIATSPLLERIFPAREMLEQEAAAPAAPGAGPGLMLCLSDPASGPAMLQLAEAWTRARRATVWAVHLTSVERVSESLGAAPIAEGPGPLAELEARAASVGVAVSGLSFPSADPGEDLARIAQIKGVPLVILGGHRSPFEDRETLGGSVRSVLQGAPCDVGVLVAREDAPIRRVGVLGDDAAVRRVAERLAAEGGVERVEGATTGVELVIAPVSWPASPGADGPSWLYVRGRA